MFHNESIDNVDKVVLDVDGVLSTFHEDCFGLHSDIPKEEWSPNEDLPQLLPLKKEKIFDDLTLEWWDELGKTDEFDHIIESLTPFHEKGKLVIATAHILGDGRSMEGKENWLNKYAPHIPFIITKHKHFLATPNSILIDDSNFNHDSFREEGGRSILYPRRWNRNWELEGIDKYLKDELLAHIRNINT